MNANLPRSFYNNIRYTRNREALLNLISDMYVSVETFSDFATDKFYGEVETAARKSTKQYAKITQPVKRAKVNTAKIAPVAQPAPKLTAKTPKLSADQKFMFAFKFVAIVSVIAFVVLMNVAF